MGIVELSVNNRVLVNLLMLVMVIGGFVGYNAMTREVFPVVPLDRVAITTEYQGVSPEEIEKNITIPIEDAIKGIAGIEHINSKSLEGVSMITAELEQGRDLKSIAQDIRSKIERVKDLPEESDEPVAIEIESEIPVVMVTISGAIQEETMREIVDDLEDRIGLIDGVASVTLGGYRDREIHIDVDPNRMYAYGIGISEVINAVKAQNLNLAGGSLKGTKEELLLRTMGEFESIPDVGKTVVRKNPVGRHIYLRDIGKTSLTYEEETDFVRVNGERSIILTVTKKTDGDSISIVNQVGDMVAKLRTEELPSNLDISLIQNSAMWIKSRLRTLYINGAIGFTLVCLTLFIFLNWRMALWTAVGIPTSFLGAFLIMAVLGQSVNMISLFALIVVLGLVVDDAIIVSENVYRHIQMGLSPKEATIRGTKQIMLPVIVTVATTIAAFVPMLMMTGIIGKFMKVIPLVVSLVLVASLVEALIILPSHLADFTKAIPKRSKAYRKGHWFLRLRRSYQKLLVFCLRRRYGVVLVTIMITAGLVILAFSQQKFVLFGVKDIPGFIVKMEAPVGTKLQETSRIIAEVERRAMTLPGKDVNAVVTMVGTQLDFQTGRPRAGSNLGQVYVELADFDAPDRRNGFEVIREMRNKIQGITGLESLEVDEVQGGPPMGAAVELKVLGDDLYRLQALAEEIKDYLETIPGVKDIRDDYIKGKQELQFRIDPAKAALYGLDTTMIARALRASFNGEIASQVRWDNEAIDILVKFAEPYRDDYHYLDQLRIANDKGALIPLKSVTSRVLYQGVNDINHKDHRRAVTVSADVDTDIVTSSKVVGMIEKSFGDIGLRYPGYDLVYGGETEEQMKSLGSLLRAYIIAMLIIYTILGGLFKSFSQPFVVMFTLPFGIIGVIIGHLVMGQEISLLSLIGLVALSGVVVNDSLLLVDFINQARKRGVGRWHSIVMSARVRMRPILLTTMTTILGLITLSFQTRGQAGYLAPMAISLVWGLLFATGLTLIVIPSLFAILDDLMVWGGRLFRLNR